MIGRLASLLVVVVAAGSVGCAGLSFLPAFLRPSAPRQEFIFEHFDAEEVPATLPSEPLTADLLVVLAHNRLWVRTPTMPDIWAIAWLYVDGDKSPTYPRRDVDALQKDLAERAKSDAQRIRRMVLVVPRGAVAREDALVEVAVAAGVDVLLARRQGSELRAYARDEITRQRTAAEDAEKERVAQASKKNPSVPIVDPTTGKPIVFKGSLAREEINSVVKAALPRIKRCYDAALTGSPVTLEGKVTVQYTIGGEGRVTANGFTDDTMGDRRVSQCIREVMQSLTYPPPMGGGEVYVTYPFVFAASD